MWAPHANVVKLVMNNLLINQRANMLYNIHRSSCWPRASVLRKYVRRILCLVDLG